MGRYGVRYLSLIVLALATACSGNAPAPPETPAPATVQTSPNATPLDRLSWLAGDWRGNYRGARVEEHWMLPDGRMMVGMHRDVFPDDDAAFEFLRIVEDGDGLIYVASPSGDPPTEFRMVEQGESSVVFENRQHDFPSRILYRREGDGLVAKIAGQADGKPLEVEWRWTRSPTVSR